MKFLRGQAAIALSLAIPIMVGAACIGADMRALYLSSARLQQAADAAVLCGAAYLPANPALAQRVALEKAQMNGIRTNEVVYNRSASDGRSITMVVERKVPYRFTRLLGLSQSLVTVRAIANTGRAHSAARLVPISTHHDKPAVAVIIADLAHQAGCRAPASVFRRLGWRVPSKREDRYLSTDKNDLTYQSIDCMIARGQKMA